MDASLAAVEGRLPLSCLWTHLEIDDNSKDEDGGDQVHEVGEILAVERLSKGSDLVCAGGQQVEQRNDGAFKFHPYGESKSVVEDEKRSLCLSAFNDPNGRKAKESRDAD